MRDVCGNRGHASLIDGAGELTDDELRASFGCVPARVGGIERVNKWTYVGRYRAARKRRWNAGWISKHCCSQAVKFAEETVVEDVNLVDVITTQKSYAVIPDVIHFDHRVPSDFVLKAQAPLIAFGRTQTRVDDVDTIR